MLPTESLEAPSQPAGRKPRIIAGQSHPEGAPLRLYWYRAVENFGDALNVAVLRHLGVAIETSGHLGAEAVCIGSVLDGFLCGTVGKRTGLGWAAYLAGVALRSFLPPLTVWGSGFLYPPTSRPERLYRCLDVRAVRGAMTLGRLMAITVEPLDGVALGDPGLFARELIDFPSVPKRHRLGLVPHFLDRGSPCLKNVNVPDAFVLDVAWESSRFLTELASCEAVASSSLHGLVVADSLGIPNIRLTMGGAAKIGDWKFDDYYSAFGQEGHAKVDLTARRLTAADLATFDHASRGEVDAACDGLMATFPREWLPTTSANPTRSLRTY